MSTEALSRVKYRFRIPQANTTFDADINKAVEIAVEALAPYAKQPQTPDTSLSVGSTVYEFTWDSTTKDITKIEYRLVSTDPYTFISSWSHDDATVYLREHAGQTMYFRIHYTKPYTYAGIANIPTRFNPALIDFSCAEYAAFLAGSKTAYDIYMQATGSRAVDSMTALSEFYENRGERRAEKVADPEGLL